MYGIALVQHQGGSYGSGKIGNGMGVDHIYGQMSER